MKRKKLPKQLQDAVRDRQKGVCACCIERGREFHHVDPHVLGGRDTYKNIALLCKYHHKLVHLGDLETIKTVLEYTYYLNTGKLLTDLSQLDNVIELVKKDYILDEDNAKNK